MFAKSNSHIIFKLVLQGSRIFTPSSLEAITGDMLIHDSIYSWQGFGGPLRLGSGKCNLSVFDLRLGKTSQLTHLRPMIVVVSDVTESSMSVRSCAGHIATNVTNEFKIQPQRMLFVEHYPETTYGDQNQYTIAERYDMVEFTWMEDKAIKPRWHRLTPALWDTVSELMRTRNQ
jgi:hypothetical protein